MHTIDRPSRTTGSGQPEPGRPGVLPPRIPQQRSWPLIGNTFHYLRDADGFMRGLHREYGEIVRFDNFGMSWIGLYGPDANQLVYQNKEDAFASDAWNVFLSALFDRGLMAMDRDEHRLHRGIMQKAFSRDALASYLGTIQRVTRTSLDGWSEGDPVQLFDRLKAMTLDIAIEVFTGAPGDADAAALNRAFLDCVQAATSVVRAPIPGTRWPAGLRGRGVLEAWIRAAVPKRRAQPGTDLMSRLCQATVDGGRPFTDQEIVDHMIFLLMAAHDTTTITLTNMMYQLARHPDWQDRLRAESRSLGDPCPDQDALDSLQPMGWVMKEALRLVAPVLAMPRRTTRVVHWKGWEIPANHLISISPWVTHFDPAWWHEPERFDPERFAPQRREDKRHPFQWVPFGGGAHMCIGLHFGQMEIRAILHQLLGRFEWSVPSDYRMPQNFRSLPIPKDGLPVRLRRIG